MFKLLIWLAIGLGAGVLAKMVTPQKESTGWVSSIAIGLIGSVVGGWIAWMIGLNKTLGSTWLGDLLIATGGAILVLFIYHKYLADKLNLRI